MSLSQEELLRKHSVKELQRWLDMSSERLERLFEGAGTQDEHLKVLEAAGKLAERFGKFAGLEKSDDKTVKPRKKVVRVVYRDTEIAQRN